MIDLARPAYADDDGSADPRVRALLADVSEGVLAVHAAARALRDARLLATVVAVADAVSSTGADKDSHMAVVSMVTTDGRRGLLAFSGVDALADWDRLARPVPACGRDLARAAVQEGAAAVVIDVSGPRTVVLEGPALMALADDLDLARVQALVQAALAPLTGDGWVDVRIRDVRGSAPDPGADIVVELVTGGHPDGRLPEQLAQQAARILGERPDLARAVPGGLAVALAPAPPGVRS